MPIYFVEDTTVQLTGNYNNNYILTTQSIPNLKLYPNSGIYNPVDNKIILFNNNTDTLTLSSDNKIGIGNTTPSEKLTINNGNILLGGTWNSGSYRNIQGNNLDKRLEFHFDNHTTLYDNNRINFFTNNNERMRIDINGNVGIGTNNPTEKLDVNGNIKATNFKGGGANITGINYNNITLNKPTNFQSDWTTTVINKPTNFQSDWTTTVINKPTNFQADWNTTVINKPTNFQSDWNTTVINKPTNLITSNDLTLTITTLQYPPKVYNSNTSESTTTFLGQSCYYQTITISSGASYGLGTYYIYSSSSSQSAEKKELFNFTFPYEMGGYFDFSRYINGVYIAGFNNYILPDYKGEWIVIKLPQSISLSGFSFYARSGIEYRAPGKWRCYGSKDGVNFTKIDDASNDVNNIGTGSYTGTNKVYNKTFTSFTLSYSYIGFTVQELAGNGEFLNFCELVLYAKSTTSLPFNILNEDLLYFSLANTVNSNIGLGVQPTPSYKLDVNGSLRANTINATTNLQENGTNLSSKYLLISSSTTLDTNSSNYVLNTSNSISNRITSLDTNSSNYVLNTSNTISNRITSLNTNSSNYVLNTSNSISNRITSLDTNSSNYVLNTSNVISNRITNLQLTGAYLSLTGGTLTGTLNGTTINAINNLQENGTNLSSKYLQITDFNTKDTNSSNYVLNTSNIISNRITTLTSSQWTTSGNNIYYTTGNIGIGKTNPTYNLDVNGFINGSNLYVNNKIINTHIFNSTGLTHGAITDFNNFPDFGNYFVMGTTNSPAVNSASQYYGWYMGLGINYPATGAGSYGCQFALPRNVDNPYLCVRYKENNAWTTWRKISAGLADSATSATNYLPLTGGSITGYLSVNRGTVAAPTTGRYGGNGDRIILWEGGTGIYPYSLGINGFTLWYSVPSDSIHLFYNGGTETFRIAGNGNVGIGTTNPSAKLHIEGDIRCKTSLGIINNAAWDHLRFSHDGSSAFFDAGGSESGIAFRIDNTTVGYPAASYTEVMRLLANGNVGIGTNNPTQKLEVNGDVKATYFRGDGTYLTNLPIPDSKWTYYDNANYPDYLYYNGGYIGIGTNTPVYHLDIYNGTSSANVPYIRIIGGGGSGNKVGIILNAYYAGSISKIEAIDNGTSGADLVLSTNSAERLRILNNGYVGIGTNNPSYILDVNGNMRASSYSISGTNTKINSSGSIDILSNDGYIANFRHTNTTQGIAIGYNTISASGTNTDQDIYIAAKGAGYVSVSSRFSVSASTIDSDHEYSARGYYLSGVGTDTYVWLFDVCSVFGSAIWVQASVYISSDERIKKNIEDINDDSALQKILAIQPKKYNYIDTVMRGTSNVYGFISQQVKEVIPEAVGIQQDIIPNIYTIGLTSNIGLNTIINTSNIDISNLLNTSNIIRVIDEKGKTYDDCLVLSVDTSNTFTINKNINTSNVFVYGTKVDDFHTLDKSYIYTLNVCATQELHRLIQNQQQQIDILTSNLNLALSRIDYLESQL